MIPVNYVKSPLTLEILRKNLPLGDNTTIPFNVTPNVTWVPALNSYCYFDYSDDTPKLYPSGDVIHASLSFSDVVAHQFLDDRVIVVEDTTSGSNWAADISSGDYDSGSVTLISAFSHPVPEATPDPLFSSGCRCEVSDNNSKYIILLMGSTSGFCQAGGSKANFIHSESRNTADDSLVGEETNNHIFNDGRDYYLSLGAILGTDGDNVIWGGRWRQCIGLGSVERSLLVTASFSTGQYSITNSTQLGYTSFKGGVYYLSSNGNLYDYDLSSLGNLSGELPGSNTPVQCWRLDNDGSKQYYLVFSKDGSDVYTATVISTSPITALEHISLPNLNGAFNEENALGAQQRLDAEGNVIEGPYWFDTWPSKNFVEVV